jgi:hypothetical protein
MTIINLGNNDISFSLLPVGTTSTTVAQGDHTHTLDQLSDVEIIGTPAPRQVIKYDGTKWINELPSGGISIGATPPESASSGDAWFDSNDGSLYVYYDDGVDNDGAGPGTSAQWVQVKANSALEASILTRLSAVEARIPRLEQVTAIRVLTEAQRDALFPSPTQGNKVFRADLGYEQKYFEAFDPVEVPDGTTGTPGWYGQPSPSLLAHLADNNLPNSINTINRQLASTTVNVVSETAYLTHFTPQVNLTISQMSVQPNAGSSVDPTYGQMAIYSIAEDDVTMTRIASTGNLAGGTFFRNNAILTGTFTGSVNLVAGQRYAAGFLVVGNTGGTLKAAAVGLNGSGMINRSPAVATEFTPQTGFPSSLVVVNGTRFLRGVWSLLTP